MGRGGRSGPHFLGRRSDALAFIAAADVVVNPSDHEGLPVALLEALALARPVAAAVGGVPSVVRSGETGLLVRRVIRRRWQTQSIGCSMMARRLRRWGRRGAPSSRSAGLAAMVSEVERLYRRVPGW